MKDEQLKVIIKLRGLVVCKECGRKMKTIVEIDEKKEVTIHYKFRPLNEVS